MTVTKTKPTFADLTDIANALMQADLQAARLRARLYAMICDLYDAGERPFLIAAAAGVTRQRINQVKLARDRRESP